MKKIAKALIMLFLLNACSNSEYSKQEETLRVSIEQATFNSNIQTTPYVGVVEEEQATMVSFTGMAVLKSIKVSEGQFVQKGQLLATIDDTQAKNALEAAKAALNQAADAQTRMKQLYDKNSLPEMKWVEIESKVQQARSSYEMCKKTLDDCSVYAPCSGVVGSKVMNVGETVLPSQPVLTILGINKVKVRLSIPEKEIASVTAQTPSTIALDALHGETFYGGKIEKGVSADAITHTYDIRILLDNADHKILPGMVAKATLNTQTGIRRITLPVKAVQQSADKSLFVWIVKDGKACRQRISIGKTIGNRLVVEDGLNEGDSVIVEGYQKVGEGTPVTSL